jgi:hypothetical protein
MTVIDCCKNSQLTTEESETIAARVYERITDLELELAARDFNVSAKRSDK